MRISRSPLRKLSKKKLEAQGNKPLYSTIKKRPRKKSETLRIYGPPGRAAWMKRQGCWFGREFSSFNCAGQIANAHTVTGGTGRKADADTIIPLCASHHELYDHHEPPFDTPSMRSYAKSAAKLYERWWLEHGTSQ